MREVGWLFVGCAHLSGGDDDDDDDDASGRVSKSRLGRN